MPDGKSSLYEKISRYQSNRKNNPPSIGDSESEPTDIHPSDDANEQKFDGEISVVERPKFKEMPRGVVAFLLAFVVILLAVGTWWAGTKFEESNIQKQQQKETNSIKPEDAAELGRRNATATEAAIEAEVADANAGIKAPKSNGADFSAAAPSSKFQAPTPMANKHDPTTPTQHVRPAIAANEVGNAGQPESVAYDSAGKPLPPPPPLSGTPFKPKPITNGHVLQGNDSAAVRTSTIVVLEADEGAVTSQGENKQSPLSPLSTVLVGD